MKCYRCASSIEGESPVHGLHLACFLDWFNLDQECPFEHVIQKESDSFEPYQLLHTSFFVGKFKKYSAQLEGKSYILKVQEKDYPELPLVEYTCNQMARSLGLSVPDFYLIRFLNEVDTFVVHNFMTLWTPSNLIHIYHFLNADQLFDCATLLSILEKKVSRRLALVRFVELCLFDALIGNHDRHGRNLGIIETPKETFLAPFYDNPSYLAIEETSLLGALHDPRGKISTSVTDEPTLKDYVREFTHLGYGTEVKTFYRKCTTAPLFDLIERGLFSEKRKQALCLLVTRRLQEFADALS